MRRSQRWSRNGWGKHVSTSSGLGSYGEAVGAGLGAITRRLFAGQARILSSQFLGPSLISAYLKSLKDGLRRP